jgi:hypothetical protein
VVAVVPPPQAVKARSGSSVTSERLWARILWARIKMRGFMVTPGELFAELQFVV